MSQILTAMRGSGVRAKNVSAWGPQICQVYFCSSGDRGILQALVVRSPGRNGLHVRHYGPLRSPRFARGCFAVSEAASRPPIVVKWYYEGSTYALRHSGPPALGMFSFPTVILHYALAAT